MGFYWFGMVYLGRLMTQPAYDRLLVAYGPQALVGWVSNLHDARGRYVLHPPRGCVLLSKTDAVLTSEEVDAGTVPLSSVKGALTPEQYDRVSAAARDPQELARLAEMVRAASDGHESGYAMYVLQGEWSSLSGDDSDNRVKLNLPVGGLRPPRPPPDIPRPPQTHP